MVDGLFGCPARQAGLHGWTSGVAVMSSYYHVVKALFSPVSADMSPGACARFNVYTIMHGHALIMLCSVSRAASKSPHSSAYTSPPLSNTPTQAQRRKIEFYLPPPLAVNMRKAGMTRDLYPWQVGYWTAHHCSWLSVADGLRKATKDGHHRVPEGSIYRLHPALS